jgi:hypothetical protein
MTTRRKFFIAVPALAATVASVTSTLAHGAEEQPDTVDFLFVQTAKSMTFDPLASRMTLEGVSPVQGEMPAKGTDVSVFLDIIGMPRTPISYAGVGRRDYRRAWIR